MKRKNVFLVGFILAACCLGVSASSALPPQTDEAAVLMRLAHDSSGEDFRESGARCATCHGNVFTDASVLLKNTNADGVVSQELLTNHHRRHEKSPSVMFGADCTYCHSEFTVATTDSGFITVSSYVDKTSCPACHSNFNPTGRMAEEYIADGCPGCHGEGDDWRVWHFDSRYAPDIVRRFVDTVNIPFGTDYCLDCHGFNKYISPPEVQDLWWDMTFEERNAFIADRGAPWEWVGPETP